MKKQRYTLSVDSEMMARIDAVAEMNNISRSAVVRMFLELARYVPAEKLRFTSPVPGILGITKEETHAE